MAAVDLRSKLGPVEQQGRLNSCVAHAATSAIEATLGVSDLSRLFVYYISRLMANQQGYDCGSQPRNAMKAIAKYGAPLELYWPYDATKVLVAPSVEAYNAGVSLTSRIKAYQTVTSLAAMKTALSQGLPVMFGFMVPDTHGTIAKSTGVQPMYTSTTKWIGRHVVLAVGFDDATGTVLCRNSFGTTFGSGGYYTMPYEWFAAGSWSAGRVYDAWVFIPA